ncbi:MAG: hypothetical protein KDC44_24850, partial [Phaeodactylibacter sp.]|nr:hypothetical protein [Phaeodactylibacter sp.]
MQRIYLVLTVMALLGSTGLQAQTQRFEVMGYQLFPEAKDFHTEESGLKIELETRYQLLGSEARNTSFDFTLEVFGQEGQLLLQDRHDYFTMKRPFGIDDPKWLESSFLDFFIRYKSLSLAPGTHQLTLRLSAENKTEQYQGFWRKVINVTIPDFEAKTFEEQAFTIRDLQVYYDQRGFGVEQEGIALQAQLRLKYGPDQVTDKHYDLFWELQGPGGAVVYRSEQAASIFHQEVYVATRLEPKRLELFARYDEIRLNGPADVRLVLYARNEAEQQRTIYEQALRLEIPQKYA